MKPDDDRLAFVRGPVPPGFERVTVVIPGGCQRTHVTGEWRDALVVVTRGEIELRPLRGAGRTVREGDVLWLQDLPLSALQNRGERPAVLTAVRRLLPKVSP